VLGAHDDHQRQEHDERQAEVTVAPTLPVGEKEPDPGEPERQGGRVENQHLLDQELERGVDHVLPRGADVVQQLEGRPVMTPFPDHVGQDDD